VTTSSGYCIKRGRERGIDFRVEIPEDPNPDKPEFSVQGSKFKVQGLQNPKLGTVNREHGTLLIKASLVGINIF